MTHDWSENIKLEGSNIPLTVSRRGDSIITSSPRDRMYPVLEGACQRCCHPTMAGETCSTCCIWEGLEHVVAMGSYIPLLRRTADQGLDLTNDLVQAKNNMVMCKVLGSVLGVFVKKECPELAMCEVVTSVPSFSPPGHAEEITRTMCSVLSHSGFREDLLVKTGNTKLTGKPSHERWEIALKEFQSGPGSLEEVAVLIVDDILTDGASMDACARILKARGASNVVGLVVGRTV